MAKSKVIKFLTFFILFFGNASLSMSQRTFVVSDPELKFKEAKDYFSRGMYAMAYPLLQDLKSKYPELSKSDHAYINDEIEYFLTVTQLKLLHSVAEEDAINFISINKNQTRRQMMCYHLGHYYFLNEDYPKSIAYYEKSSFANLSNSEIADAKFEKAYAYFNQKDFESAEPLFNEIAQIKTHKNYFAANYYFGFISFYKKNYNQALIAFTQVEKEEPFSELVPYYITEIYYFQGRKDEALEYGKQLLDNGKKIYYEKNLRLLLGQLYFERNNFNSALPLIESYVMSGENITKDIQYQLSYCYFKTNKINNAIEGFKKLSSEKDSLGQNSMYLLGSLYLKNNDKLNARNAFQYCAYNNSNPAQQRISRFNYAKLSYDLGFQDIALNELKQYISDYVNSEYDTEAKEILVNILAGTSNYNEGLTLYSSFISPTPQVQKVYPRLLYGRAIELINDQQLNAADDLLSNLVSNSNAGKILPYAHFYKAEIALRQQRYNDAVNGLDFFIKSNPVAQGEANLTSARYNMGYAYFQMKEYSKAINNFESVCKSLSSSSTSLQQEAFLRSADCYFMSKDFSKANAMYDALISNSLPQSDYAMYQKAIVAGIKSNNDKINILNSLLTKYPSTSLSNLTHMEIAESYIDDKKAADAIPYLKKILVAVGSDPILPKAYLKLGLAYFNLNDYNNALNHYKQLLDKYPNAEETDEAKLTIKDIYVGLGKPDEYIKLMKEKGVIVSVSESDSLNYFSAYNKFELGDCKLAIDGFDNYLSQFSNGAFSQDALYFLGVCHQKNKDWTSAIKYFTMINEKGLNKYYESATLELSKINYLELKDYSASKKYFSMLKSNAADPKNRIEALRGLVRSYYQLKEYPEANDIAKELLLEKSISTDDKMISSLVLGKSAQIKGDYTAAINLFKTVSSSNKTSWGAEARYETASCFFSSGNLNAAEKAAMSVIKETGSYGFWVTKSYILIGDIFMKQKDFFNAKATYESVFKNATVKELKEEAKKKYEDAILAEKK